MHHMAISKSIAHGQLAPSGLLDDRPLIGHHLSLCCPLHRCVVPSPEQSKERHIAGPRRWEGEDKEEGINSEMHEESFENEGIVPMS